MVRIEELTQEDITKAGNIELYRYRLRFCQVFEKRQRADDAVDMMLPGYAFLTITMRKRGLMWATHEIDLALFEAQVGIEADAETDEDLVDAEPNTSPIDNTDEPIVDQGKGVPDMEKRSMEVNIVSKSDDDERIVMGVVYEPDEEDTQGDYATADEIRKAAYSFMENGQTYHVMHKGVDVDVCVLESYLAPVEFTAGGEVVKKGSWVLASRIMDAEMWADIKSGELTGYSMGGTGQRV